MQVKCVILAMLSLQKKTDLYPLSRWMKDFDLTSSAIWHLCSILYAKKIYNSFKYILFFSIPIIAANVACNRSLCINWKKNATYKHFHYFSQTSGPRCSCTKFIKQRTCIISTLLMETYGSAETSSGSMFHLLSSCSNTGIIYGASITFKVVLIVMNSRSC